MVKYYYDKYEVQESGYSPEYFNYPFSENNSGQYAVNAVLASRLSEGYKWDYDLQRFVSTGATQNVGVGQPNIPGWYRIVDWSSTDFGYQVVEIGSEIYTYNNVRYYKIRRVAERKAGRVRGDFLETVVAENGTYPNNGEANGFWYVRRSVVSTKSQMVITTKSPINLRDGDSLRISGYIVNPYYSANVVVKYKVNGGSTFTVGTFAVNAQQKNINLTFTLSGGVLKNSQGQTVASNISRTEFNEIDIFGEGGDYSADTVTTLFSNGYQHLGLDAPLLAAVSYLEELTEVLKDRPVVAEYIRAPITPRLIGYIDKKGKRYISNEETTNANKSISITDSNFTELRKITVGKYVKGIGEGYYSVYASLNNLVVYNMDGTLIKTTVTTQNFATTNPSLYSFDDDNFFTLSGYSNEFRRLMLIDGNGNVITSGGNLSSTATYTFFENYNGVRFIIAGTYVSYVLPGDNTIYNYTFTANFQDLILNEYIHMKG